MGQHERVSSTSYQATILPPAVLNNMPQGAQSDSDGGPQQQPRRRNVVSRDRTGCFTCRRRHLRCDKAQPECSNCQRLDLKCEGYGIKFAFRDQTFSVAQKSQGKVPTRKRRRTQSAAKEPASAEQEEPAPPTGNLLDGLDLSFLESPQNATDTPTNDQSIETGVPQSGRTDWAWQDWSQTQPQPISDSLQITAPIPTTTTMPSTAPNTHLDRFIGLDFLTADPVLYPSISSPISSYSTAAFQGYQSPRDTEYFQGLLEDRVRGLATILPLRELIGDDYISAPHLYNAALALSALNCPDRDSSPLPIARSSSAAKGHALRHYATALRTLHSIFPNNTAESFRDVGNDELLAWFLTRLLLANFDLRWGSLSAWRAHLRSAGRILSAWHNRIMGTPKGRQLAQAFARMALLVNMQSNDEHTVTGMSTMNPGVASDLASMIERSESPRDRLLALIQEVSKLELKFRYSPGLAQKWTHKMEKLEKQLNAWQRRLPVSELPIDTGLEEPIKFLQPAAGAAASAADLPAGGVLITPLTFPGSADPYTAAVNYAHFLCARMRTRTRYAEGRGRMCPPDSEATARHICRIAAGLSPAICAQADAFGHGMMPAVVGAYRWTEDSRLRAWIEGWLAGYEAWGPREGIWNVSQTRRLLKFLEGETARRRRGGGEDWDIVAARIKEEDAAMDEDEQRVWDFALSRSQGLLEYRDGSGEGTDVVVKNEGERPFRIVLHSKSVKEGWATDYYVVQ